MPAVIPLPDHDAVMAATGRDAFARWELADPLVVPALRLGDAIGLVRVTPRRGRQLFVLARGTHAALDVAGLLAHVLGTAGSEQLNGVSVPQWAWGVVAETVPLGRGNDWTWMATRTPPPTVPREAQVASLTPEDRPAVLDLLETGNPGTDALPWRTDRTWVGMHGDDGRLVACGAREPLPSGAQSLLGITVAPDLRGRGLGRAVSARLTRDALTAAPAATLGVYSDNEVALRTYAALGYAHAHPWSSRRLGTRPL